ncbi:MAG: hypothetical protein J4O03_01495 [Chloroflexi bacterium]|nr:hypothetical protein [Chloroflexota bacterium]MCH8350930.1 hypothetical protein [Chloroflexota bacterium]MCI0779711.1 hypothetical protein [Chloroflexota bacterium]MCI0784747.1 hypothetical protein [Chloroflexota bacterium]MCI0792114.1 hypothetical protein [Chloroflexota bacterium]
MKAEQLNIGVKVQLVNGATAEVLAVDADAHTVLVRYLDSPFEPGLIGTEGRCSEDDVTGFYEDGDLSHTSGRLA